MAKKSKSSADRQRAQRARRGAVPPKKRPVPDPPPLKESFWTGRIFIERFDASATLKAAQAGDLDAAREILCSFVRHARGHKFPEPYLQHLAAAISRILDGEDAQAAFGIRKPGAGRRASNRTREKARAIAAGVELLQRHGKTKAQAIAILEQNFSRPTINRAIKAHPRLQNTESYWDSRLRELLIPAVSSLIDDLLTPAQ
jgi:hypothetical protein